MKKSEFQSLLNDRFIFLDGATGTNLMKAGMPSGVCPEQWIIEHADIMEDLQRSYVEAGSRVLYAPTFTTNRIKLSEYGLYGNMEKMIHELVGISKRASAGRAYIAGDLTMTGQQLAPMGTMDFEELVEVYKEQIRYLVEAGVDLLVVETMMSLQETRAAVIAAKEVCDLPVMATLTFESDGRTLFGTDAASAAITLESLGVSALGANCSTGPKSMLPVIREMVANSNVPIIAKPNAGLPEIDSMGNTRYAMAPEEFAEEMKLMVEAGVQILGGCCGTTPEHIKALGRFALEHPAKVERRSPSRFYLSSERKSLVFDTDSRFFIVGERINPTGKKKLQAELKEGKLALVDTYAEEQEQWGAKLLDVNVGMGGVDEKSLMRMVLEEVESLTSLPLCLDSSSPEVMEDALRRYPGRALINSVSAETIKLDKMLPLAARYGAMFILLPLSDQGLPASVEERIGIIESVTGKALKLGLKKEDIVVDALVQTVAADPGAAKACLETIRWCKEHGYPTICGLSNISFGLPQRGYVNAAFLTMAIQAGLTCAIANPNQPLLQAAAYSADLLMGKEGADQSYIEFMQEVGDKLVISTAAPASAAGVMSTAGSAAGNAAGRGDGVMSTKSTAGCSGVMSTKSPGTGNTAAGGQSTDVMSTQNDGAAGIATSAASVSTGVMSTTGGAAPHPLYTAVLKGNKRDIKELTRFAIESGEDPGDLLEKQLMPAISAVGELFDKGKYFLPQLISGAEAMKNSIEFLEPYLAETKKDEKKLPVIVIASVKGDIHDIGKNLVAMMLKNYGFPVMDLGKDVPREQIVEEAKKNGAGIIALSALMTTTMTEMKRVIEYAKEQGVKSKVMIGGAVITQEYADEIEADGYSEDAAAAVKLAQRLLNIS